MSTGIIFTLFIQTQLEKDSFTVFCFHSLSPLLCYLTHAGIRFHENTNSLASDDNQSIKSALFHSQGRHHKTSTQICNSSGEEAFLLVVGQHCSYYIHRNCIFLIKNGSFFTQEIILWLPLHQKDIAMIFERDSHMMSIWCAMCIQMRSIWCSIRHMFIILLPDRHKF